QLGGELEPLTGHFREVMTAAARWMTGVLSLVSIALLVFIALLAALLGWCLVRVLRGTERKFRAIFEQAAVGMAQVDAAGRILNVNSALCQVLDYPKAGLLDLRYRDLVHPEDWELGRRQARNIIAGELDSYTLEQRF